MSIILGLSLSLDGYSNDRHGDVGPLYPDPAPCKGVAAMQADPVLQESIATTGAVVMGRHTFNMAADPDWYAFNYEYQVPIFVLTHQPPARHPKDGGGLTVTFVTAGVASALTQARAAAGERHVTIIGGGAQTAQQCLRSGLVDEIHVDVMPLLLGGGLRPLDAALAAPVRLERLSVHDFAGGGTHLRFRVLK